MQLTGTGPKDSVSKGRAVCETGWGGRDEQEREVNCVLWRLPLRGVGRGFVLGWWAAGALEWRFWPWWIRDGTAGGVSSLTCWGLCPCPLHSLQEHTGTNVHQVPSMASDKAGSQR